MYRIKIGCNVRLNKGEKWPGRVWKLPDGSREARLEPGEQVERLPEATDVQFLLDAGAIEPISEISDTGSQEVKDG